MWRDPFYVEDINEILNFALQHIVPQWESCSWLDQAYPNSQAFASSGTHSIDDVAPQGAHQHQEESIMAVVAQPSMSTIPAIAPDGTHDYTRCDYFGCPSNKSNNYRGDRPSRMKNYKSHVRDSHTGAQLYQCSMCHRAFKYNKNRGRHFRKKHTSEMQFSTATRGPSQTEAD